MNGSEWNVAGQGERQILNRYRNRDGSAGYAFWRSNYSSQACLARTGMTWPP
jgi:hypothetical protein